MPAENDGRTTTYIPDKHDFFYFCGSYINSDKSLGIEVDRYEQNWSVALKPQFIPTCLKQNRSICT